MDGMFAAALEGAADWLQGWLQGAGRLDAVTGAWIDAVRRGAVDPGAALDALDRLTGLADGMGAGPEVFDRLEGARVAAARWAGAARPA